MIKKLWIRGVTNVFKQWQYLGCQNQPQEPQALLWSLQFPGESVLISILGDQSQRWIAKGRTGKYSPVMKRYKCIIQLNVQSNGYHWDLIMSHHWLSWVFDWHSLSKEPWHCQLLPDACCLLLSTGHAPVAEAAGGNICSCPGSAHSQSSIVREAHVHENFEAMHEMEQLRWGRCLVAPAQLEAVTISKGWDRQVASSKSGRGRLARAPGIVVNGHPDTWALRTCVIPLLSLYSSPPLFSLLSPSFLLYLIKISVPWMVFSHDSCI